MASDPQGALFISQGPNAPYTAANLAGGHWNGLGAAAAPLVAVPTTAALTEFWNNSANQMVMEITDLFLFNLLGTAAVHNVGIWAMVTAPKAVPTNVATVFGSQSGRGPYTSTVGTRVVSGTGASLVANGWRPWGPPNIPTTYAALPGIAYSVPIDGKLTVPPGCSLCITGVDALATGTIQLGAAWLEKALQPGENVP